MYEIKENRRRLKDGTEISTYTRDVVSCNILEVEAGTTGYRGGDTGHGGRTYFRIKMRPAPIWMSMLCEIALVMQKASRSCWVVIVSLKP